MSRMDFKETEYKFQILISLGSIEIGILLHKRNMKCNKKSDFHDWTFLCHNLRYLTVL